MWYLVVPPVVVVLSLLFLVWYLLRKKDDPIIAQKVLAAETKTAVFLPRVKGFFLKSIEKLAYRFKVGFLRAHNALNEFMQSVKKIRTKMDAAEPASLRGGTADSSPASPEEEPAQHHLEPPQDSVAVVEPADILSEPIIRQARRAPAAPVSSAPEKKLFIPRPMVSEAITHPEKVKNVIRKESPREESLIGRIARDPKDFTAYEELGDYYLEAGNIKDAKECYRQVLKLSPVHRLVKIKIRRLEKLLTRAGE